MKDFKTIDTINTYSNILHKCCTPPGRITKEEEFIMQHPEFDLAKSLIQDFDKSTARRLGKVLLGAIE